MFSKLKKLIFSPLPASLRAGFNADLVQVTYRPMLLVGVLVALFEVVMIITTLLRPGSVHAYSGRAVFFWLYVTLLGATAACLLAIFLLRKYFVGHPGGFLALSRGYALFICLWGSSMSAFSHRTSSDISVFLYVVLFVALVVPLAPWQAFALYVLNELVFLGLLFVFLGPEVDAFGGVLNSAIASLLAIIIASLMYHNRAQNYYNRVTITQQNDEIIQINDRLQELVYVDDLTGIHNRRYLDEKLPDELDAARKKRQPICLMMMDLDQFKQYNDLYGHQAGDICLKAFTDLVKGYMCDRPGCFIRYGGEEFILMLPGHDAHAGLRAANTVRQLLADAAIPHKGSPLGYLTVSIGLCASGPRDEAALSQLIGEADQALYIAKFAGRDRVKVHYSGLM